jgi:predicted transcriptional regulator
MLFIFLCLLYATIIYLSMRILDNYVKMKKSLNSNNKKMLLQFIEKSGYTISDFCNECDINKSSFYRYLSGGMSPTVDKLLIMSKTLKIPLKQLCQLLGKDVTGIPD